MKFICFVFYISILASQNNSYVQVLGIAQDAGYPQMACQKYCCKKFWDSETKRKHASSLALIINNEYYLFEATPDIKFQLQMLYKENNNIKLIPNGIFLTHAHVGHYTGLIHLGREIAGTKNVNVFVMPKMKKFLENNGPWEQLISINNIELIEQRANHSTTIKGIKIIPHIVPHRDEYSETVGYQIISPKKKILFIPDIDKWHKWDKSIIEMVKSVDVAFLDATFNKNGEIKNRDMSEIPHPFVTETIDLFKQESKETKSKIHFIHFNHTNPILFDEKEQKAVREKGFQIAIEGMKIAL